MFEIKIGEMRTIMKFQIQCEETLIATPRVRASKGNISGPQTQGTTLTVPPKMSM